MAAVFLVSRQGRALAPTQLILCGVVLSAPVGGIVASLMTAMLSLNDLASG